MKNPSLERGSGLSNNFPLTCGEKKGTVFGECGNGLKRPFQEWWQKRALVESDLASTVKTVGERLDNSFPLLSDEEEDVI